MSEDTNWFLKIQNLCMIQSGHLLIKQKIEEERVYKQKKRKSL